jgi:cellulose synthase/poly-beta-1,6-N-acetylglucosamine synthase-like glycosyltransferase
MGQEMALLFLKVTALYFLIINVIYGILTLLSWMKVRKFKAARLSLEDRPPVSFLIPAFNEENLIVETIQTYLSLPIQKEIIVINDGSSDSTLKLLKTMYQLHKSKEDGPYTSVHHPELHVISGPRMGKAQALNQGIDLAQYDLICTMDADTIPAANGVMTCLASFAKNKNLLASGGVIQVLGTQFIKDNSPGSPTSQGILTTFQRIEYLRTFICERLGWSHLGSTLLISGAFCMIKKEALLTVGGFRADSITEDFDLIVRMRRHFKGENHHFQTLPVTTCYTQVPKTLKHLEKQRIRWQMGLLQTLAQNLRLFFNPSYGAVGLFTVPYFWLVKALSPVLEWSALILIPFAIGLGWIPWKIVALFLLLGLAFNLILTMTGVWIDNNYICEKRRWFYPSAALESILVNFGYKQIISWWQIKAIFKTLLMKKEWGEKPREEIIHQGT